MNRLAWSTAFLGSGTIPLQAMARPGVTKLTILHTNDWHSRIEPFPEDGGRNAGKGGAARRAALVAQIRAEEEHVLLLDAGDVFQGTPYFNFFEGELEFKIMSQMRYDAAAIGNHDFDGGIDNLAQQLQHANFPLLCANYDFANTPMEGKVREYQLFEKGPLRIGVFGLGIELNSLVPEKLYGNTQYQDPIERANKVAEQLKEQERCDLVICLSHLGFRYDGDKVSDVVLAAESKHIDLIIGGHTHTFLDRPEVIDNRDGEPVLVNQVGWAGLRLGRLDLYFERKRRRRCVDCDNLEIG